MMTETKKIPAMQLTRPLSSELEQLRQLTYGLCAQENITQDVCAMAPVNFAGTLLYAKHSVDFIRSYNDKVFVPHPDLYNPFEIIENVGIHRMDISTGRWVPADLIAQRVLVKHICGTRIGLVIGSSSNPDPLAGLLLRSHREYSDFTYMRAIRIINDEPCDEKKLPYSFKNIDRLERASVRCIRELMDLEARIASEVKQYYLKMMGEHRANLVSGKIMTSQLLNQLFIEMGIDADVEYFHMTKW